MDELALNPSELAEILGVEVEMGGDFQTEPPIPIAPAEKPAKKAPVTARPAQFAPLQSPGSVPSSTNLDLLLGVSLRVTVELGRTKMNIEEVLRLGPGSVVELDKLAGEPVDVLVNERLIALGEVVVLDDRFGVRITDVLPPAQRIKSL